MDTELSKIVSGLSKIVNCRLSGLKNVDDYCRRNWSPKSPLTLGDAIKLKITPSCENCGYGSIIPFPSRERWEKVKNVIVKISNNEWDSITLADIEEAQEILCDGLKLIRPVALREMHEMDIGDE